MARTLASKRPFRQWRFLTAALCVLATIGASQAHADYVLTTADFATQKKITVNEWSLKDGLSFTPESGALVKLATREVVTLSGDHANNPTKPEWQLILRNNDVLEGSPAGIKGQSLQFTTPELGTIDVPLKLVAVLQPHRDHPLPITTPADRDTVRLKNGDLVEGVFTALTADKVSMSTNAADNATLDIDLARVDRVSLGGVTPARLVPPLSARFTFASGTILTTTNFNWTIAQITLNDPAGTERKCSQDQLTSIEVLGGRVVWLTELDPATDEQTSTFNAHWPTQINRNAVGSPLVANKIAFDRGLGVHTRSVLVFDLDGSFESFAVRPALDDSSAPLGQANLSVLLDGKVIWQKKDAKPGVAPESLTLPITGGKHLELSAEAAGHLDVLGRVDWLAPALIRK